MLFLWIAFTQESYKIYKGSFVGAGIYVRTVYVFYMCTKIFSSAYDYQKVYISS